MIRAAEDLVALTKSLKEAWLFGQLGSGFEGGVTETDEDATVVGELLRGMGARVVDSESAEDKGKGQA
jgi:hypothetical protein